MQTDRADGGRHFPTTLRRRTGRRRGQSLVELALALPILLILAFGVVDLARAYALKVDVSNQAQTALRAVTATPGATLPPAASGCTFTTSPNPLPTAGFKGAIKVTYSCPFTPLTPVLSSIIGTGRDTSAAVGRASW